MMSDKIHEECGVFGLHCTEGAKVARDIYYGLCSLQHRGQESAGICVCNTAGPIGNISFHKDMGLVRDVFSEKEMEQLQGNMGIGHVRYSTTGKSCVENAQPLVLNYLKGTLAVAHNGNIINSDELRQALQSEGSIFRGDTDSEVIAFQIAKERTKTKSVEEAIKNTVTKIKGGFALLVMSPRKLIGVRDPLGIKPLCLGKLDNGYVLSSESCALSTIGATFVRDVKPGEMVIITENGVASDESLCGDRRAHCIFEYIYFARQDSVMDGIGIYEARIRAGRALARRNQVDADIVVGVPDSGITAAVGYAQESEIPFALAFQKNSYVGRTFIKPTQGERETSVHLKLSVLEPVVKGKSIVLIDDSIVRGTTIANLIKMLRKAGAKAVHVRICSPTFLHPCYYGTDIPTDSQLIAHSLTIDEICEHIGADTLHYMELEDLSEMTGDLGLCRDCLDGKYPLT